MSWSKSFPDLAAFNSRTTDPEDRGPMADSQYRLACAMVANHLIPSSLFGDAASSDFTVYVCGHAQAPDTAEPWVQINISRIGALPVEDEGEGSEG